MKLNKFTLSILTFSFLVLSCSKDDDTPQATPIALQNLEVTIDENPTNGDIIGAVHSNSATPLTFTIVSQTPAGALEIDSATGELSVLDETLFDFESNPTITATVSASGASNNSIVTIELVDKPEIGEYKYGGVIFWVNATGNEGLVCATTDQSTGIQWYNGTYVNTGATSVTIGSGESNTNLIVNAQGAGNYAAQLCHDLVLNGYDDWFLPSIGELQEMYSNKEIINATSIQNSGTVIQETIYWSSSYWSSTENNTSNADIVKFYDGVGYNSIYALGKATNNLNVRAIRSWTDL